MCGHFSRWGKQQSGPAWFSLQGVDLFLFNADASKITEVQGEQLHLFR